MLRLVLSWLLVLDTAFVTYVPKVKATPHTCSNPFVKTNHAFMCIICSKLLLTNLLWSNRNNCYYHSHYSPVLFHSLLEFWLVLHIHYCAVRNWIPHSQTIFPRAKGKSSLVNSLFCFCSLRLEIWWRSIFKNVLAMLHHAVLLCINKLVVLTTEWLPWLHKSWRDSGYKRFTLVWTTGYIRQPEKQVPNKWQPSVKALLQVYFKVTVRNLLPLMHASRWFFHRCFEGCQCVVVARWTGQLPIRFSYAVSLQYQK